MLLILLLLLEVGLGVLTFILKDKGWIKNQATYGLRNFILHYREDPDQQNLIDYIQTNWECCGIDTPSGKLFATLNILIRFDWNICSTLDWDANRYFNCTSSILGSREACGVPFSCCKTNLNDIIANKVSCYMSIQSFANFVLIFPAMRLRREKRRICKCHHHLLRFFSPN